MVYYTYTKTHAESVWHWNGISNGYDVYAEKTLAYMSIKGLQYKVEELDVVDGSVLHTTIYQPDAELVRRYHNYFIPAEFWDVSQEDRPAWLDKWIQSGGGIILP